MGDETVDLQLLNDMVTRSVLKGDLFQEFFRFHIRGIEVTQGVQYYRASTHLTDLGDRPATAKRR